MVIQSLAVTERTDGVLVLEGELDCASAPALDARDLDAGGQVDVDMADVSFIDAAGLQALLRARRRPHTTLRVVAASPAVHRVLELTGVADLLLAEPAELG